MQNADSLISELNAELASFDGIQLYIPVPEAVRNWHELQLKNDQAARFPFWAKLWPSSIAMMEYIRENSSMLTGKTVLELAGGLGLPSLTAARYALEVTYTDLEPAAVALFSNLIRLNHVTNLKARTLDWNFLPFNISADVLLLSDVNYQDTSFETLHRLVRRFVEKGSVVILTTPMRLIGRDFIAGLLPLAIDQQVRNITSADGDTMITVLVLKRQDSA